MFSFQISNEMNVLKKLPYPFEKIALAVSLSSSIDELVDAAFNLSDVFGASLFFIHVGNEESAKLIEDKINELNDQKKPYSFILEKGDVVEQLLDACKKIGIDLLIGGALEKENPYKYYLGSVSRNICRKAKCSVMLIKEPIEKPLTFSNIVVNCVDSPKTEHTLKTSVYISKKFNLQKINIVHENHVNSLSAVFQHECTEEDAESIKANEIEVEKQKLHEMIKDIDFEGIEAVEEYIFAKPGLGISNFARNAKADLLMVNSPDKQLGLIDRIFPHDLEYTLENLPTSLLIVHSRTE